MRIRCSRVYVSDRFRRARNSACFPRQSASVETVTPPRPKTATRRLGHLLSYTMLTMNTRTNVPIALQIASSAARVLHDRYCEKRLRSGETSRTSSDSIQEMTDMTIAPQNAAQNPGTWKPGMYLSPK